MHATFGMDDFGQRAMIEGTLTPRRGPFNLYDLIADDNRSALLDRGVIPWWSEPHLTIRFLRPLPSLLIWVDHRLFGNEPFGPHVLSFLWWAAAVLAAHVLYRTVVGNGAAWIATLVFAVSPSLAIPVVWLANRSILVSVAFGALALALYVRWRAERGRGLGLATAGAFGAARSDRRIRAVPHWVPDRLRVVPSRGDRSAPCRRCVAGDRTALALPWRARDARVRHRRNRLLSRSDNRFWDLLARSSWRRYSALLASAWLEPWRNCAVAPTSVVEGALIFAAVVLSWRRSGRPVETSLGRRPLALMARLRLRDRAVPACGD